MKDKITTMKRKDCRDDKEKITAMKKTITEIKRNDYRDYLIVVIGFSNRRNLVC